MAKKKKPTKKELMSDEEKKALLHKRRKSGYSRNKGLDFERDIASDLRPIFPDVRRLLENHKEDANGVDLLHTGNYRFQCKRYEHYVSPGKIAEIQCEEWLGEIPVLVTRANSKRTLAVLPFEHLLKLLEIAIKN